ncbi:MAG TPA: gamma-glutamyltransferase, partial [Terracidiphilus sp.]|nr:gamma-glutamyltransferase [Terracidiphilus sp.]
MRRRSFVAALPLAVAGTLSGLHAEASEQDGAAMRKADSDAGLPKFQPAGTERFLRPDVHAGDRPSGASFASRSAAMGRSGAAGTAHPIATLTAIETLKRGGSAVDAAVAANACLGFLEPTSCGLGGDCYAMIWDPKLGKVVGMAGSGRSPKSLTLETVRQRAVNGVIPKFGAVAVSTPGALDAWWTLHRRYGRLKWEEILQPAIALCEEGVPVPQIIGHYIGANLAAFTKPGSGVEETANAVHTFAPNGHAPREGD